MANRPEDFFFNAPSRFRKTSEDGRLNVETIVTSVAEFRHATARYHLGAFFFCEFVVRKNFRAMFLRNQWPGSAFVVVWPAKHQTPGSLLQRGNKAVEDSTFHINALGAEANLPRV